MVKTHLLVKQIPRTQNLLHFLFYLIGYVHYIQKLRLLHNLARSTFAKHTIESLVSFIQIIELVLALLRRYTITSFDHKFRNTSPFPYLMRHRQFSLNTTLTIRRRIFVDITNSIDQQLNHLHRPFHSPPQELAFPLATTIITSITTTTTTFFIKIIPIIITRFSNFFHNILKLVKLWV
ncbi:hypothetical protein V6Z11_D04G201800 [Gossypium hirsutum]